MMRVNEVMSSRTHTCQPDQTLREAAEEMFRSDIGGLPVVEDPEHRLVGFITDRDICRAAMKENKLLKDIRIRDAMSSGTLHTCRPDSAVGDVEKLMRREQIRRIPVVDEQGKLAGILSLADLALHSKQAGDGGDPGRTLAGIVKPGSAA